MISVPPNIQSQLGDAISVIADSDFWERWETLVDVRIVAQSRSFGTRLNLAIGSGIPSNRRQSTNKQRSTSGGAFDFQTMATLIPV